MNQDHASFWRRLGLIVLAACASWPTVAQQPPAPSPEEIARALSKPATPPAKTRSFQPRGVTVEPATATAPPSIDLYVNFKYDSAELEPDAMITLRSLATALNSPQLKDAKIEIFGHTDAKGSESYNLSLSERRAAAVRQFLVFSYGIEGARLAAFGRGKSQLKDPAHPEDGINRRVEVRNVSAIPAR